MVDFLGATTAPLIDKDPIAKKIKDMSEQLAAKEFDVLKLKRDLNFEKAQRTDITIKWRDSVYWCINIDSHNPMYFLKSSIGVCNCIAFKHQIDIDSNIKNKVSTTLSILFKEKAIGRIQINNIHYYGLKEFFNDTLTDLKPEFKERLSKLIL